MPKNRYRPQYMTYREALAQEYWEMRSILIKTGYYTDALRKQHIEAIKEHMAKFPKLYKKLTPRQEFARDLIKLTRIFKDRGIYPKLRLAIMKNTKEEISKNQIYKK